ncbi:MAG: hypothetical protein ABUL48_04970 [Pseudorhodoplanes sp.]
MRSVGGFLQRLADQKSAEAKENLDAEFSEVAAIARDARLGQSRDIEMMAEQNSGSSAEAHEIVAVLAALIGGCAVRAEASGSILGRGVQGVCPSAGAVLNVIWNDHRSVAGLRDAFQRPLPPMAKQHF